MTNDNRPCNSQQLTNTSSQKLADEAEAMIWELLDDRLDEDDCNRLQQMITEHEEVRLRYLGCVQMHVGLHDLLAKKADLPQAAPQSPVLGSLGGVLPSEMPGVDSGPAVG